MMTSVQESDEQKNDSGAENDLTKTALLTVAGIGALLVARKFLVSSTKRQAGSEWAQFWQTLNANQKEADHAGPEDSAASRARKAALAANMVSDAVRISGESMMNIARNMGPDRRR